jgi:AcrR family transcriptional regulator
MARPDKRKKIIQAAEGLFSKRLYHEVTLDEVCRIAEVGKGTIYLYFKDKEELFLQTVTSGFDELCEELRAQVPSDMLFESRLRRMCEAIAAHFIKKDPLFRMLPEMSTVLRKSPQEMHEHFHSKKKKLDQAVMEVLAAGVVEKRLQPNVSCEALMHFLVSMLVSRARDFRSEEHRPSVELILNLFLHGAAYNVGSADSVAKKVKPLKKGKETYA